MGALYLAHEEAWRPGREPISLAVYGALGPLARPSLAVHLLRRGGRGSRALLAARRSRARDVRYIRLEAMPDSTAARGAPPP